MQPNDPQRQHRRTRSIQYGADNTQQPRQETSRYQVPAQEELQWEHQPLSAEEIQRAQRAARRQSTMNLSGTQETRPLRRPDAAAYDGNPYANAPKPDLQQRPPQTRGTGKKQAAFGQKKGRVRPGVVLSILVFAAIVALIVLISPKEPLRRATYSTGTADGTTGHVQEGPNSLYQGLVISEIMPDNKTSVPDQDGKYPDWVEIWNSSDKDISLKGVGLSDDGNSIRFLFPDVILPADGRVIVFCDDTNMAEPGKPYHAKFKLSSVGETVYLYDPNAFTLDSVTYPIMSSDESYALIDGEWQMTKFFSPGYPNGEAGHNAYREETTVLDGALVINEVMADPVTGLRDEDGELVDWIELYNNTDEDILLDNYALSNKESKPLKWRFPEGARVPAHSYYLVFCSGKDRRDDATAIPHTNFRISAEHDTIVLSDSRGRLMDRVTIDNLPRDCSYGRDDSGVFKVFTMGTPTLPNNQIGLNQMDYNMRQMNPTGVFITEVMASNDSVATLADAGNTDWIEIYNSSNLTVDLSGYGLSDNLGRPRKWQFPAGTMIMPGEHKLILCDGNAAASTNVVLHSSFKLKRAGSEIVCLSDPTGKVLDKLVLPEIPTNVSYGRTIGLAGFFYYDAPTPQRANNPDGFGGYAPIPSFTEEPGLYYRAMQVSITIPENTTVYYTRDGSIPTRESTVYDGNPIDMDFTTVLRARAFPDDAALHPSAVRTGTWFINAYHTLPMVSLAVDPDELWNPNDGILTAGDNVDKSVFPFKNTVYREFGKIGRPANVEYYLLDGTKMLNQGAEIALQGQFSLDMPQKTFKLRAKSLYGAKTFAAKLFDDREYTEYKSFVLRNSGNDC
ncbi:MAG: lamin tail domain-containing protein, partial [Clostridia bacterium]|nr:lamin tail domain-containing protein [Clostridia bacterium]